MICFRRCWRSRRGWSPGSRRRYARNSAAIGRRAAFGARAIFQTDSWIGARDAELIALSIRANDPRFHAAIEKESHPKHTNEAQLLVEYSAPCKTAIPKNNFSVRTQTQPKSPRWSQNPEFFMGFFGPRGLKVFGGVNFFTRIQGEKNAHGPREKQHRSNDEEQKPGPREAI